MKCEVKKSQLHRCYELKTIGERRQRLGGVVIDFIFMDDELMSKKVYLSLKPDADEVDAGEIFLSCVFDGNLEKCFLDTGANRTSVSENDFFKKYPSVADKKLQGAFGKPENCHEIVLEHQILGDVIERKNISLLRSPSHMGRASTIGLDTFAGNTLCFNFDEYSLSKSEIENSFHQGSIRDRTGLFVLNIFSNDIKTAGVWDTGAGLTSVDTSFISKHPTLFEELKSVEVGNIVGGFAQLKIYSLKALTIGEVHFSNLRVIAFDFEPLRSHFGEGVSFIIGYNVITQANWKIDFASGRWNVSKLNSSPKT